MAMTYAGEIKSVGLDNDESWKALSCLEADSLLRVLSFSNAEDRIFANAPIFPMADGQSLYIRPQ